MEAAQKPADSTLSSEPQSVVVKREPKKELVSWTAPSRPFKRYSKKFYVTIFSIVGIIGIILFVAEGMMPVVLLVALIFLFYVLSTVPPEEIEYKITNQGIKIAGKETSWGSVIRFWFTTKSGSEMLMFDTTLFPGRLQLVVNRDVKDSLKKEISAYVPYEEMPPSFMDKVVGWFIAKLPND